ncbi:MAG: HD domain-containing phosphohydrolase [Lachnospiraceae bacterium]
MNKVSIQQLLDVGIALSREKNSDSLFERILTTAMDITNCDGGTLYSKDGEFLKFKFMVTKSKHIKKGGKSGKITLPPVPLSPKNVCSQAALSGKLINIADVYTSETYDFTNPKSYDAMMHYRTMSMLVVPMEDDKGGCIGVLQLINALNEQGDIIPFDSSCEPVILSLASQTAIFTTNMNYAVEVRELLDSLVRVMSTAIDARTPYNANHTRNMVKYADHFISWLNKSENKWNFNERERRQFIMSVWLHDAGKLTVPLEIMDKETRLGNHLATVLERFRIIALIHKIEWQSGIQNDSEYAASQTELARARELILKVNEVGYLQDELVEEINALAQKTYIDEEGIPQPWLTNMEQTYLSVRRGTLTSEERGVMESHVTMTATMLQEVKFPSDYAMVPIWAGEHHEFLNGTGYPQGLKEKDIPREVRLLTILDIFDALTARDRPYKAGMPAEKAFTILQSMQAEGKLDATVLQLFFDSHVWEETE